MAFHSLLFLLLSFFAFVTSDVPPILNATTYQSGQFGLKPNQTYLTSNVTSPIFLINTWDKEWVATSSHIFINYLTSPRIGTGMFFSAEDLSLVWFHDPSPEAVSTVQVQEFQGNDYLTFWVGKPFLGYGVGKWLMLNSSYDVVYNITTNGLPVAADLHEFRLTDEGTALIPAYIPIPFDLSSVGGTANDSLVDSAFQEVDVITGKVLFTWHSIDHFSIADSVVPYQKGPQGWDWSHINSIQKTSDGHYIASLAHCSMVVYINGTNGNPIWIMGGKKNQFTDTANGKAPDFAFQHDVVFYGEDLKNLSMFDNHIRNTSYGCTSNCSTARFFTVDQTTKSLSSVRQLSYPKGLRSMVMGNVECLDGGNTFVNWGHNPALTEHRPDDRVVLDVRFGVLGGQALGTYRAHKSNWKGYPTTDPSIVVRRQNGSLETLYVSWNGATEVKRWILLASAAVNPLARATVVDAVPRAGFETAIIVGSPSRFIRAVGLDAQGEVLGMSAIWDRQNESMVNVENRWQFQPRNLSAG